MNTIKTILASEAHNPHYLNKYIRFITNCQAQNENYAGYTEKHHICPRAMFPEFSSFSEFPWNCGELKHINNGKVTVRDIEGNTFQVDKSDSRYISGELVGVAKGLIAQNRALSIEQVKEIRLAIKNPVSVITNEFLSTVVKPSQQHKIGSIPFEELKYINGMNLSYKSLIAKYYSNKFNDYRYL